MWNRGLDPSNENQWIIGMLLEKLFDLLRKEACIMPRDVAIG